MNFVKIFMYCRGVNATRHLKAHNKAFNVSEAGHYE